MPVPTVELPGGRKVRLGRVRPRARPQVLRLRPFLELAGATPPPESVDYTAKAQASIKQVYGNDQYGDCVIAGKMHHVGVWSGNDSDGGGCAVGTADEAVQQYQLICGPGDQGCVVTQVLDYMRANGLVVGGGRYRLDGYVAVTWTDKVESQVALYLFGGLTLGINLPKAWLDAPDGGLWDVTSTRIVGGHDVAAVGYNPSGVVVATWGGLRTITWPAFTSKKWLEECYAILAPAWYNADALAPSGVNVAGLKAALATLADGGLPPIPPQPAPPGPPPPPEPPPAPPPAPAPLFSFSNPRGIPKGGVLLCRVPVAVPAGRYDVAPHADGAHAAVYEVQPEEAT